MPKDYKRKKKRTFLGNRYGAKPKKKARVDNVSDNDLLLQDWQPQYFK